MIVCGEVAALWAIGGGCGRGAFGEPAQLSQRLCVNPIVLFLIQECDADVHVSEFVRGCSEGAEGGELSESQHSFPKIYVLILLFCSLYRSVMLMYMYQSS